MKLVSMQLPKVSKKEMKERCMPSIEDEDRWPYGLAISFDTEQIDKLPALKTFKLGDKILIMGEATVTELEISERQVTGGKDRTRRHIRMQIEQIGCEAKVKKKPEKMSTKEYRNMREMEGK